ncbi:MAG: alpha-amylase, partial [Polyangiaceae bacterium]|nr:alpha-amylase [Polyangiaceae bacterium]
DNHDVPRFLYSGAGVPALHNALLFLFTAPGMPCVYYGTEQQFAGGNDPANREDLWKSGYDTGNETFQWIKKISKIRRNYPALTKGETAVVWASDRTGESDDDAGIFAFERFGGDAGDSYALVVFNTSKTKESSTQHMGNPMAVGNAPAGEVLVDVLSGTTYTLDTNKMVLITLPQQSGAILVPQSQLVPGL